MSLHTLHGPPPPDLARALAEFEAQFTYPLGPGRTFRISHGDDYPRFFRAQGDGACFVLEESGQVAGALGVAVRRLLAPDGGEHTVAYVGDLKVAPAARRGLAYLRLAWAAHEWVGGRTAAGYGVVMDGTAATPDTYTGQFGIPAARVLGRIVLWKLRTSDAPPVEGDRFLSSEGAVRAYYRELSRGRFAAAGGRPEERSEMPPVWLRHPDGLACGLVEDTRRAKRLHADDGAELRSAHLSFFAWRTPEAGRHVLDAALAHAARRGHPALFVAVPRQEADTFREALGGLDRVEATATVYGSGLDDGAAWNVNTAEI